MKIVVNCIPLLSKLTGVSRYLLSVLEYVRMMDKINRYYFYYGVGFTDEFFKDKAIDFWELLPWKRYSFAKYIIGIMKYNYRFFQFDRLFSTYFGNKIDRAIRYFVKFYIRPLFDFRKKEYNIYFEPNFIPLDEIEAKRTVVTVHDFSFFLYPQWHPKDRVLFFSKYFWKNIYRADVIITVSNFIKTQAQQFIKGFNGEIVCIYNGYDSKKFKVLDQQIVENYKKYKNLPDNFILFVGSIEPRKNLINLLKAYEQLPQSLRKDVKLVLVGFYGWRNFEIMKILNRLRGDVFYFGHVKDEDLVCFYNLALFSIYPSLYEGFGLPNIESMACGCPVVTSDIPPIREVCKDAVVYIDPFSVESIKEGMLKLIENTQLRKQLRNKGLEHVKNFSWEESAKKHLELFNKLC